MTTQTLLQQLPLFAGFSEEARAELAARCVTRTFAAGHVLFGTNDVCRGLYIVASGRVRVYRTSPSGREQVLHSEGPGRPVAELPLLDGGVYPASAVTEVESRLVFVPRDAFEALYRNNPDVAQAVIRELGKRLRHLVLVAETLAFRDVAARLASYLAQYAEQHGTITSEGTEISWTARARSCRSSSVRRANRSRARSSNSRRKASSSYSRASACVSPTSRDCARWAAPVSARATISIAAWRRMRQPSRSRALRTTMLRP